MRGNFIGKMISMMTFGESHGEAIGVVIDGIPSKLQVSIDDLQADLDKRRPGRLSGTTSRNEADEAKLLSGLYEGQTLGTPICVVVYNHNQKPSDYDGLKNVLRPGHADATTLDKFGIRDHRGGGRSSGRETISRVIAGYFAGLVIPHIKVKAYCSQIGDFKSEIIPEISADLKNYQFCDPTKDDEIEKYLIEKKQNGESVTSTVNVIIENCPKGLGEPVFDKIKADFAKALMSIGGCLSFFILSDGIEGGITNSRPIHLSCSFKAPSTTGEKAKLGRHDPCLAPRVVFVVEAMVKFVIADHFLRQNAYANKN